MASDNRPGDGLLLLAMFIWLTIAVGPWWLGVGLFAAAGWLNSWWMRRVARRASSPGEAR